MSDVNNILLVEDHDGYASFIQKILCGTRLDLDVERVSTLVDAEAKFESNQYDAVLLDLTLPDSEGVGTVRRCVASAKGVPVIVMTGNDDEKFALEALSAGAQDYIVKGEWTAVSIARSITYAMERRRFTESTMLAKIVFDTAAEGIAVTDDSNRIITVNKAFTRITGYDESEIIGKNPRTLSSGRHDGSFYTAMWKCIRDEGRWEGEIWNRRKNGDVFPEWLTITSVKDDSGNPYRYVAVFTDIMRRKRDEALIKRQANYDFVTELPNRRMFRDHLQGAIAGGESSSAKGQGFAVMFIDLDRFKWVNDTLGHRAGDDLLRKVSSILIKLTTASDLVARLGGDEFTIFFNDSPTRDHLEKVAQKIISALSKPFRLSGYDIVISCSIGIASWPDDGQDADELIKNSETAMYKSKDAGRSTYRFFNPSMNEYAIKRLKVENELRQAVVDGEFEAWYQPIFDAASGNRVAAEALMRWRHPTRGIVPPGEFIPIAEDTGLIIPMTEVLLDKVCADIATLLRSGDDIGYVSINVSALHFMDSGCAESVRKAIEKHGIPAEKITIEVTEGVMMNDVDAVKENLDKFKSVGVRLALDDFGTGYSSLKYLQNFPFDILKIDKSFLDHVAHSVESAALTRSIVSLAKGLRLKTVAEGIEQQDQLAFLQQEGCEMAQGYYFSKPLPFSEFISAPRHKS